MELEEKTFPFEIKALTEEGQFEGYASIFGKKDNLNEIVEIGAFTNSLKEKTQYPMLWYHDPRDPIGIVDVEQDGKGLKIKGQLNLEVQSAKEKYALMKQKVIRGLSFGFKTIVDSWDKQIRFLKEIKLYEISPVTFGAHPKALISSVKQWSEEKPYPNEHSARIKSPDLFDKETFRRTPDGTIYGSKKVPATAAVIWGKLKGSAAPADNPIPQAIRFPTKNWTVTQAKKWLKDNNIKYIRFEAASKSFEGAIEFLEEFKGGKVISSANLEKVNIVIKTLEELLKFDESVVAARDGKKNLFSSVIESLETENKPKNDLFRSTIKILENTKEEK